jgi:colanic acid/amylovoran biosynthesis glycosyltransferase
VIDGSSKPTVLIFKETLLPVSETFVAAQADHLTQFRPRYVGLGRVSPSLPLPDDSIVLTNDESLLSSFRQKLYRRVAIAPGFHRKAADVGARLIHAHFASGGRSALPLARHLRIPLVVTLHGSDVTTRMNFRHRYEELWKQASLFICVSNFIRDKALEAGFPEEKLVKLFIGVDGDVFRPAGINRDPNLVLFVGRLVEKKGCSFLLNAMARVQKEHPNARTVVVGDGPLRTSLQQLAQRLGLSCEFLGSRPAAVVREWMSRARVFCAPSVTAQNGDSEGLGMVFAEAQAMGTPVVSFSHGGIPEVVLHERTGLLAPEGDEQSLSQHICRMLDDELFWGKCVQEGIAWVSAQFNLHRQTRELEEMYDKLCRTSGVEHSSKFWHDKKISAIESRV